MRYDKILWLISLLVFIPSAFLSYYAIMWISLAFMWIFLLLGYTIDKKKKRKKYENNIY